MIFLKTIYVNFFIFFLDNLFYYQNELLLNNFYNFQSKVYFLWSTFLYHLLFYLHYHHVLNIIRFYVYDQTVCIHITQICFFVLFLFYTITSELMHLMFCLILVLNVLNRHNYLCIFEVFFISIANKFYVENFVLWQFGSDTK